MIGDKIYLKEDFEFNDILYRKGHQFTVISSDGIRGEDIEDSDGNIIYETRFISHLFRSENLSDIRNKKLEELGIEDSEELEDHCYICGSLDVDKDITICDMCDELYCYDCSYTFTIHYQHQGSRCYSCADQRRRTPLNRRDSKINKILLSKKNK